MTGTVAHHYVLCVVPDAQAIRERRLKLPDINTSVLFTTPGALHDGHQIRGMILCHVIGMDHLGLRMTGIVETRLRQPEHECPGRHIDTSRYLWGGAHKPEERR